ncbi:MAG TPA: hypothetical protein VGL80_16415 [Pseudonocardiaceae bacterium]|jgi:hypothetical protein
MTAQAVRQPVRARSWLRGGLVFLIVVQAVVGGWQYFFSRSFYDHFPTVALDPPFNQHLMSDVGGLGLALTAVLVFAAVHLEYRLVCAALTGYIVYAATHVLFHLTHLDGFSTAEAVENLVLLVGDVVIPVLLLVLARRALGRR